MVAKVESACLLGMEGSRVHVEVCLAKGLPVLSIVGLPDASVREAKDRVVAAIRNSGFKFPSRRVTVNLAPAEVKKEGPFFDLAIAMGILLASEAVVPQRWPQCLWLGELALDGSLRPVRGALPLLQSLSKRGCTQWVIPERNVAEISFLEDLQVYPFANLRAAVQWVMDEGPMKPVILKNTVSWNPAPVNGWLDLSEIKGQAVAKRALEIAAAGNHNLLMMGCPGTGKTLLAQSLPSLLPEWNLDEALDATQVHSVASLVNGSGLLPARPFRSPHHSVSTAALVGGGDIPMPGEISLAHRGVLFLDELPEFRRDALEALRQPMEEGVVHIHRARGRAVFPSQFLLIAAMNPCPCGYRGHPLKECICSFSKVHRYLAKISGPLLDRFDLHVEVPVLKIDELFSRTGNATSSQEIRQHVERARARQRERFGDRSVRPATNSQIKGKDLQVFCELNNEVRALLQTAIERLGLSARAFDRLRRVARTIADLENSSAIDIRHMSEAIQYRVLDREPVL